MSTLIATFSDTIALMQLHMSLVLSLIALLWGIQLVNYLLGYRLNILGIYPRNIFGLFGIVCSPFLHGNASHLFFNTIPLFLLLNLMLTFGVHVFYEVSAFIIVVSGALVWLFGRKGFHVGASGLIMGYLAFVLTQAYFSQSPFGLILGALGIYYCGGLLLNLLPQEVRTSWEGHVFGFLAGILSYFWLVY
jgi:membrane associated rhomboid family serine protease